jgi:RimJ/RimL family protein N-acetyltransferase
VVPVPVVPVPVVPVPVPVPPEFVPPVPAPVPPWVVVPVVPWVVVPVPLDDELTEDWSCVCVWSLDEEAVWSAELESDEVASAEVPSGNESFGTDAGTTSWLELSLPQALTPKAATARRANRYFRMREEGSRELGRKRRHAAPARGTVVEIALRELVAPVAEPQRLDGPGQLRLRRRQRQHDPHDLELLAGLAVGVDPIGVGLDDDLAPRGGRAQAVSLTSGHTGTLSPCHDAAVPWRLSDDVEEFADHAWDMLARDPTEQTVALSIVESLRMGHRWSEVAPVFGWYPDDADVLGAVCMTPPFELLLATVPDDAIAELVDALRTGGVALPGVNGDVGTVERFVEAWLPGTDLRARTVFEQRLYALGTLLPPDPPPPGRARPATDADVELATRWLAAFQEEAGVPSTDVESYARASIADRRLLLWDDGDGAPVSLASRTPPAAGVARLAPVYTPPASRRRGYGAAVTAACTADALERGAEHVVLFTDLANPTSNAIYQRIGYRPMSDRRVVRFEPSDG